MDFIGSGEPLNVLEPNRAFSASAFRKYGWRWIRNGRGGGGIDAPQMSSLTSSSLS